MNSVIILEKQIKAEPKTASLGKKWFTTVLVLMPILNQYGFLSESIGIGELCMAVLFIYFIFYALSRYKQIKVENYTIYFFYLIVITFVISTIEVSGLTQSMKNAFLQDVLYIWIFSVAASSLIDIDFALKIYKVITFIVCVILIVQYLLNLFFAFKQPWLIHLSLLPVKNVLPNFWQQLQFNLNYYPFRPASIFSEPALFVQYVSPYLFLLLGKKQRTPSEKLVILLICLSMLLTVSANGMIILLAALLLFFMQNYYHKGRVHIYLLLLFAAAVTAAVLYFCFSTKGWWLVDRLREIDSGTLKSGSLRVVRGWDIFSKLPVLNQFIGVGNGNIVTFLNLHNIRTIYDAGYLGYMSGLSEIFVIGGLLGAFIYFAVLTKAYFKSGKTGKNLILLLLLLLLSSSIYHGAVYAVILSFVYFFTHNKTTQFT